MVQNNATLVAPPDKYFYTIDRKILTNMHQLSEYLNNCPDGSFHYHATPTRNDLYNWIKHVFGLLELAERIKENYDKKDCARIISEYLSKPEEEGAKQERKGELRQEKKGENMSEAKDDLKNDLKNDLKSDLKNDLKNDLKKEESAGQTIAPVASDTPGKDGKFREFSDEELEKFTKFGIKDKETPVDEKLDYLNTEINEIRNMIKEQRRLGKDMIIADLMLRVVGPKMSFYEFTRNHEDYEKIMRIMGDIKREIDYASQQAEVTLADEIIKQLELQSVMLKKDFTPQKQGIKGALGKIFKPANQEV